MRLAVTTSVPAPQLSPPSNFLGPCSLRIRRGFIISSTCQSTLQQLIGQWMGAQLDVKWHWFCFSSVQKELLNYFIYLLGVIYSTNTQYFLTLTKTLMAPVKSAESKTSEWSVFSAPKEKEKKKEWVSFVHYYHIQCALLWLLVAIVTVSTWRDGLRVICAVTLAVWVCLLCPGLLRHDEIRMRRKNGRSHHGIMSYKS